MTPDEILNEILRSPEYPPIKDHLQKAAELIWSSKKFPAEYSKEDYAKIWEQAFSHLLRGCPEKVSRNEEKAF
jgi:hypothetical protein